MRRSALFLGLLMIPVLVFMGIPDLYAQVPFNVKETSHPHEGDPNDYWCFDCHYFENNPTNEKWVKTEIQLLPWHLAYYDPGDPNTVTVYYPYGTDPELVTDTCPTDCGPCQVCHTQTQIDGLPVWRNNGTGKDHGGLNFGTACLSCHLHWDDRYMFYPAGGGTGPSHDLHLRDAIKGPKKWNGSEYVNIECVDCHGTYMPRFADDQDLAGTTVCNPCHSKLGAFDGVGEPCRYEGDPGYPACQSDPEYDNWVAYGAKQNWVSNTCCPDEEDSEVYNAIGTGLKIGKKDWCLGCHDRHKGTSQIAGVYAPAVGGDNVRYGFRVSGHGRPGIDRECEECHNLTLKHIDGLQRTYSASSAPNNYKVGYRLMIGMIVPRTSETDTNDNGAFDLCTDSCHDYDKLTGPASGFRGAFISNRCGLMHSYHEYHFDTQHPQVCGDSDFDGTPDSHQTCILCHNVHGSPMDSDPNSPCDAGDPNSPCAPNPVMIRHGELISTPGTTDKVPAFDFKYYDGDCNTDTPPGGAPGTGIVGALTTDFDDSRWGTIVCGGTAVDFLDYNKVCFGCHTYYQLGPIQYHRGPTLTVDSVWTADPNTDQPLDAFSPTAAVRYKARFTVAGPPSSCFVRTYQARAQNNIGPSWLTKLPLYESNVSPGTYVWAADHVSPLAWDKDIPSTATLGTDAAKVVIPLLMVDHYGGTLLDYDSGAYLFDIIP